MNATLKRHITLGAAMALCVGAQSFAPAPSHADTAYSKNGTNHVYERNWSDRHYGIHTNRPPNVYEREYYTDQYGDLDTVDNKRTPTGYGRHQTFISRSSSSWRDRQYRNELRRADGVLERDIREELEGSPFVDADRVNVKVRDRVATLTGVVEDRSAMVTAVENAYEGGARKVINKLRLANLEDQPWTDMSDRSLAREVRSELSWSPFVDEDPIRVSVKNGVVTLRGTVEDQDEMAAAVENAYEAGARRVKNHLRISN